MHMFGTEPSSVTQSPEPNKLLVLGLTDQLRTWVGVNPTGVVKPLYGIPKDIGRIYVLMCPAYQWKME